MKNIIAVFVLISSLLFAAGCSNDFDMYADYKDITIVYSMVDISTDTTWVKITKAYTGPGNALLMAQNPDSSNYPYKLDASIVGKKNGSNLDPIVLDTLTIHNKPITDTIINENGDTTIINPFYSPNQLVYYGVGSLDKEAEYTLSINKNDSELTASTNLVNSFSVTSPVNRIAFTDSPTSPDGKIEWHSTKHGIRYEVLLRFNYLELSPGQEDTLKKHVDWFLGVVVAKSGNGDEELVETYSGPQFYSLLESELEPIPNVQRWVDDVDITIASGSQTLATYLDINAGTGSLLDEVPTYSNISGGSGIFASRYTTEKSILVSVITERTLVLDYDLGFKYKTKEL
jgi:hypothetical protein